MNSEKFSPDRSGSVRKIVTYALKNIATVLGIATVVFAVLSLLPSEIGATYPILAACCAFLWACAAVGVRFLKRRWEVTTDSAYRKAGFWTYVALVSAALLILIPFYVLLVTSIKTLPEANDAYFTWWPKMGVQFDSIKKVFTDDSMGITILSAFFNTLLYYLPSTAVCVFVSSLSAYAFSKLYFPGNRFLFAFLIFTMMIPGCSTMTSSYLMYNEIGLTGTVWPLFLPHLFGSVSMIFFMREYFAGIPNDLLEAAKVEGAGKLTIFFSIMLPLGFPVIAAQFILNFVVGYNDYLTPLLYLRWPEDYTLTIMLKSYNSSTIDSAAVAASCVFSILPLLALYFCFQKQILKGVSMSSGLKG